MSKSQPQTMWWCPTCKQRIPQPRWMNMRKPNQRSYHLVGLQDHTIEKVPVMDGELVTTQAISAPA